MHLIVLGLRQGKLNPKSPNILSNEVALLLLFLEYSQGRQFDPETDRTGKAPWAGQEEPGGRDPELQKWGSEAEKDHLSTGKGERPVHHWSQWSHPKGTEGAPRWRGRREELHVPSDRHISGPPPATKTIYSDFSLWFAWVCKRNGADCMKAARSWSGARQWDGQSLCSAISVSLFWAPSLIPGFCILPVALLRKSSF